MEAAVLSTEKRVRISQMLSYDQGNQPDASLDQRAENPAHETKGPPPIVYKEEYLQEETRDVVCTEDLGSDNGGKRDPNRETTVLEYVEVVLTQSKEKPKDGLPSVRWRGQSYIRIISPCVTAALRHVVNYYPSQDLSGETISIQEPYAVVVHFEDELKQYRQSFAPGTHSEGRASETCTNRFAYNHIGTLLDFVDSKVGDTVRAERERNARGYCTDSMRWLMFKPGTDVYWDQDVDGTWNPFVVKSCVPEIENGQVVRYLISLWNLDVGSVRPEYLGMNTFADVWTFAKGETKIFGSSLFPCSFFPDDELLGGKRRLELKKSFEERGRMFVRLLKKGCFQYEGSSYTKPVRAHNGIVMVDADQWTSDRDTYPWARNIGMDMESGAAGAQSLVCACARCQSVISNEPMSAMFEDYDRTYHRKRNEWTDHHYFLCSRVIEAFVFKTREWGIAQPLLNVSGFKDPVFDRKMINDLVLAQDTKDMIVSLTKLFVQEHSAKKDHVDDPSTVDQDSTPTMSAWSADFVKGKGEGLIFLLHGKPGVGKTYTAECVAALTERPLLSLTCADIGTDPQKVEESLRRWFSIAQSWGAIMLIDEADVYMEQRKVQDLERNNLVAGFLRALEYYQGILILTTNRVGTFDEAFISRIHITIHYAAFTDRSREEVWESFFRKLQNDREGRMKILEETRDYVTEKEVRELEWNGREIRNAFQIAVALAQTENDCDARGRIQVKRKHIRSTVQMSRNFKSYLQELYQKDETQRAAAWGHRYDAFEQNRPKEGNFK